MKFNKHLELEGKHAFLSASKHSWINYTEKKLEDTYKNELAAAKGTELHELASGLIKNRILQEENGKTFNSFVNDAINFKMDSEVTLFYSYNCFGTADAISFRNKKLKIHDLKTGVSRVYMEQLMIYAALFCLEYKVNPMDILIELRIYKGNEIIEHTPDGEDIQSIMDKIVTFDKIMDRIQHEEV